MTDTFHNPNIKLNRVDELSVQYKTELDEINTLFRMFDSRVIALVTASRGGRYFALYYTSSDGKIQIPGQNFLTFQELKEEGHRIIKDGVDNADEPY